MLDRNLWIRRNGHDTNGSQWGMPGGGIVVDSTSDFILYSEIEPLYPLFGPDDSNPEGWLTLASLIPGGAAYSNVVTWEAGDERIKFLVGSQHLADILDLFVSESAIESPLQRSEIDTPSSHTFSVALVREIQRHPDQLCVSPQPLRVVFSLEPGTLLVLRDDDPALLKIRLEVLSELNHRDMEFLPHSKLAI